MLILLLLKVIENKLIFELNSKFKVVLCTFFTGVRKSTIKTIESGGAGTSKKDNKNVSTKSSVKVLGASNRISLKKIGTLKDTSTTRTSMSRRSRTSKRMSLTINTKKATTTTASTNRKTIDPKSFNRKSIVVGRETSQTDSTMLPFAKPKKSTDKFRCKSCEMTFFLETSLAAHEKSHTISNTCRYCNRNFAIATALSRHLRENCSKISIAERKKLLEIDDKSTDLYRRTQKTPTRAPKLRRSTAQLLDLVYKSCPPLDMKVVQFKNVPSIRGIRNTPRKLIKCYCGDKFQDPCSYATHAEHCITLKSD